MKRGILIDVENRVIREVEFDGLKDMYRLIDCDLVECVSYGRDLDIWVDEEGLLKDNDKGFFMVPSYPQPLKGNGLLTGGVDAEGKTLPCKLSLDDAEKMVKFLDLVEVIALSRAGAF
jgi:hypothetical protein